MVLWLLCFCNNLVRSFVLQLWKRKSWIRIVRFGIARLKFVFVNCGRILGHIPMPTSVCREWMHQTWSSRCQWTMMAPDRHMVFWLSVVSFMNHSPLRWLDGSLFDLRWSGVRTSYLEVVGSFRGFCCWELKADWFNSPCFRMCSETVALS